MSLGTQLHGFFRTRPPRTSGLKTMGRILRVTTLFHWKVRITRSIFLLGASTRRECTTPAPSPEPMGIWAITRQLALIQYFSSTIASSTTPFTCGSGTERGSLTLIKDYPGTILQEGQPPNFAPGYHISLDTPLVPYEKQPGVYYTSNDETDRVSLMVPVHLITYCPSLVSIGHLMSSLFPNSPQWLQVAIQTKRSPSASRNG